MSKTYCPKTFAPPPPLFEDPKNIATKSGEIDERAAGHAINYASTYCLRDIRGQKLGFWAPWGYRPHPKGETLCPGQICTSVQTFTAIGVTVAEISTHTSVDTKIERTTTELISNK